MLKKLISTALVVTLVLSLVTIGVSASTASNIIYFRDFDKEPVSDTTVRFADSNTSTDWVWSYASGTLKRQVIDGSTVMLESGTGGDSNVYRLANPVTSGRFYLSMDVGFSDLGTTWSDYGFVTFYTESYPADNDDGYTAFDQYGRRNIVRLQGRAAGYNSSHPTAYLNAYAGSPGDGFNTFNSSNAQEYLDAEKLHRLDMIYNLDADYIMVLLDGNVMLNQAMPADYKDAINQITAIGLRTRKGMFVDNIKIQTMPNNSFNYAVKNITASGFDIEFNHSVNIFGTSNVSVNGAAPTSVTRKNANVYTVVAPMTSGSTVALSGVQNVMGNTINDTVSLAYNQLANINFNDKTLDSSATDASETFGDITFSKTDANTATLRINASGYADSEDVLRIGIANYANAATDEFLFNFNRSGYLTGKVTVAYNAKFAGVAYVEPYIVFNDDSKYKLPWYTSGEYEYNGTTVTIKDGAWYNIKNVLDFDTNTITAYLNGKVIYQDAFKSPETFADKTSIKGFHLGVTNKKSTWSVFYLDDLDVRTEYVPNAAGIYVSNTAKTGTVGDGNTVTYTAKVFNTTASPVKPYLLTGIYNGSTLINAEFEQTTEIPAGQFITVSFSATCDENTTAVKGFIWDSLTNLTPLCPVL